MCRFLNCLSVPLPGEELWFKFAFLFFFTVVLPVWGVHDSTPLFWDLKENPPFFVNSMTVLNLSNMSCLWEMTNTFASFITKRMIFKNSSVPNPSRELSKTSSIIRRFVFAEFLNLATSLHVKRSARSILIFSPSEKDE